MSYIYNYSRLYNDELDAYADTFSDAFPLYDKVVEQFPSYSPKIYYKNELIYIELNQRLSADEETILDSIVSTVKNNFYSTMLELLKQEKINYIRFEVQHQLMEKGFEYPKGSGIKFCVTDSVSSNWNGLKLVKDDNSITYPVEVKDVSGKPHLLYTPEDVQHFWETGVAYKDWMFRTTTNVIKELNNLQTITEILKFEDPRI